MDNLFVAIWGKPGVRRPEEFWLDPPAPGLGRLVAAIAIVGVAACLLDHMATASKTDTTASASYNVAIEGSSR
ncbi:hypothetical protein EN828_24625 [Mesorhizobium sp. M2D.F.Ca.ET.185.01.1.1]|nr:MULTISPECIES: hypothetical protein [unclassified Mesorhizobium]TGP23380.1 hypothetical protein EN877_31780 [Mesorhizobium sp. M1D.F.Ca.ET.234.01.1.1]TGP48217.1 hypothetical protein EN873_35045 [bacterium M00.F.Ca.ET.230.01.1.1]TGP75721.1 hypothetical protein EN870_23715 [bacterium M00.F.Ca.ET.227.01.1.1]TGP87202.1 hypothetical protein EN864_23480 [bacterium M00.F.Ca.ET.221.01.1.1]TGP91694.1 hypothetical protein EN865_22150 [bacterium M00.F.Ca.ET.222.01.1.1]TGU05420.1 hypothetical protein E